VLDTPGLMLTGCRIQSSGLKHAHWPVVQQNDHPGTSDHAIPVTRHGPGCRAAGLERRLQAVAGGRVTESSGGMPWYGSISTRASWPVQPWLRVEEGRSAVSTLGLP